MQRSIRSRLNDILRAVDGAADTLGGADFDTFERTFHMLRTVERCIEIVSEATRNIPDEIKARYPNIPWPQIAGIGNVLRHDYDLVDTRILWDVLTVHFPKLRLVIDEILSKLPEEG